MFGITGDCKDVFAFQAGITGDCKDVLFSKLLSMDERTLVSY